MTFADGRGSTRAFHSLQRVGFDKGVRRARIQEGDTAKLHGNGVAVDIDFSGEERVAHRYYTSSKTKPSLDEQQGDQTGVGGGHHIEDVAAVARCPSAQESG